MALILWLPLIEDVTNQGLYPFPNPSYKSMTIGNTGKLGKCHSGIGIIYHLSDQSIIKNQWTLAMWVKSSSWGANNDVLLCKNSAASDHCQIYFSVINHASLNIGVNGAYNNGTSYTYSFEANTWYHVATSYDGQTIKLYINGEMVKSIEKVTTLFTDCDNLCIGNRSTNAGGTAQTGGNANKYLNDVRIYDSVISDKEIQVLSRGLMVHYQLDREGFGQDNLLTNTTAFTCNLSGNGLTTDTYNGFVIRHLLPRSGSSYRELAQNTVPVTSGGVYTESFWARGSGSLRCHFYSGNIPTASAVSSTGLTSTATDGLLNLPLTSNWTRYWVTYTLKTSTDTPTDKRLLLRVMDGNNDVYVCGWKLELGDKATPWMLSPLDELSQFFELNSETIVHYTNGVATSMTMPNDFIVNDVSGYKFNGEKDDIGYLNDAPKYLISTLFKTTSSMSIPAIFASGQTVDKLSISIWFKTDTLNGTAPNLWSIGQNYGIRTRIAGATSMWTYIRYYDGSSVTMKATTQALDKTVNIIDNNWHHWVVVFDSGVLSQYYDNQLQGVTDNSATGTMIKFDATTNWIGSYSGSAEKYVGSLSDFRLYTTALSAEAVAELYHTGASLADNGTLMTNQFVEV